MNVPFLDVRKQLEPIEDAIKAAFDKVFRTGRFIMGPEVEAFEKRVAAYCEVPHGIGVSSGTDALLACLMALETGPGDIVITTPYSFFASAGVIARLNAQPVLIDIDRDSYNMDPEALAAWFENEPGKREKVKAVIPIHLYGQCAAMDRILEVCGSCNVPVIEDAAQSIGATYPSVEGTKKAGSMGLFGCFSFFPSKNLGGVGDGGMVVTSDDAMAEKVKKLRNHGAAPKYYHALVGGNFRLDTLQAAALLVKLEHLESWHAARREHAARYDKGFADVSFIKTPKLCYGREHHIYNQYVISVEENRDGFRSSLTEHGIGNEVYYPVPFHLQECFKHLGYKKGDFPNSEYAADHTVALPVFPELTPEMQDWVIAVVRGFLG